MSIFPNAQGVEVKDGHFTAMTNNSYFSGPSGIDILREASAPEAAHDSSARSYSPRCFPGTREQYIGGILGRATPSPHDIPVPVYWMKGPAGVGKSAIAQTCSEKLQEMGALGASFFFSINGQRKPEKFFPSIAYQLSTVHPAYRDLVDSKILNDKTLISKAMRFQFRQLIDEPLRELEAVGKGVRGRVQVFVDGLDECEGIDAQCEIVRIVTASASEGTLPLRWSFFSRPEPHIESTFSTPAVTPYCYKVVLPISTDANGEIEWYLRNALNNIVQHRNPSSQTPWPSNEDMKIIVRGAGGSFIYAATVVRFIHRSDSLSPQKRLLAVIDIISNSSSRPDASVDAPFAELDAFYVLILQRVPLEAFPSVHLLLALLCQLGGSGEMSGVLYTANLLGLPKDEFETVCHHASAVIRFEGPGKEPELSSSIDTSCTYMQVPGVPYEVFRYVRRHLGGQVEFYHKSFLDFLLDPARSGEYCVRTSEALVKQYLNIHLDYDRSFCWRGSDLVLAPGVPDSGASLSYPSINELINSILKAWVYIRVHEEEPHSFPSPRGAGGLDADCDFRKWLYTRTSFADIQVGYVLSRRYWGCASRRRYFRGVFIEDIPHSNFPKSAITDFKLMVKWQGRAGIIQEYHPTLISRIKSIFRGRCRKDVESALYRVGHGEKAIFWYWEINHKLQSYREFRAIVLAEGEKKFKEEYFDSWPEYGLGLKETITTRVESRSSPTRLVNK